LAAELKKKFKRIYAIVIIVVLLVVALSYAVYTLTYVAPTGPGPVEIEVVTDKPSYLQGEQVHFSIYVNNTQNWNVPKPSTVSFQIENYSSQTVCIDYVNPPPTFAAHSRTLFFNDEWNQETGTGINRTLVQSDNYTLTVTLGGPVDYGAPANCTFEIKPNVQP